MSVAGASRFLATATLANVRGISPVENNSILGSGSGTLGLLDTGRGIGGNNGIGLSQRARALNNQFLSSTASTFNTVFSLGVGPDATVEGMQQQILALRAGKNDSQLAPSLRSAVDDGGVASSANGRNVDTQA